MNKQKCPEGKLVYLQCSSIFGGPNAHIRKKKTIRRLLNEYESSIKSLLAQFALEDIAITVRELLENRVFESASEARQLFPDLFEPSSTNQAQRHTPEVDTVKNEDERANGALLASTNGCQDSVPSKPSPESTKLSEEEFEKLEDFRIKAAEPQ